MTPNTIIIIFLLHRKTWKRLLTLNLSLSAMQMFIIFWWESYEWCAYQRNSIAQVKMTRDQFLVSQITKERICVFINREHIIIDDFN